MKSHNHIHSDTIHSHTVKWKKTLYRRLDRDVQDGLPRCLFLVVLTQDVAADLKAFGLHPEFEFGVDVAVVDIDTVGLLVL